MYYYVCTAQRQGGPGSRLTAFCFHSVVVAAHAAAVQVFDGVEAPSRVSARGLVLADYIRHVVGALRRIAYSGHYIVQVHSTYVGVNFLYTVLPPGMRSYLQGLGSTW